MSLIVSILQDVRTQLASPEGRKVVVNGEDFVLRAVEGAFFRAFGPFEGLAEALLKGLADKEIKSFEDFTDEKLKTLAPIPVQLGQVKAALVVAPAHVVSKAFGPTLEQLSNLQPDERLQWRKYVEGD